MTQQKPCTAPEAAQFDFWLGTWDVSWGEDAHGTNRVEKILGGCVIQEKFDGRPGTPLEGMSVSTYNPVTKQWHQTWVDNQGSYLDFTGSFADGRMALERDTVAGDKAIKQRMVWYNIQPDTLEWNWERSEDGGATWQVMWHIHYRRRA